MDRKTKASAELSVALERAALLGREFSLSLLKASGIAEEAIASLFDDGILAAAAQVAHAKFVDGAKPRKIVRAVPWSRRRDHHMALGKAAGGQRLPAQVVAAHFEAAHRFDLARVQWMRAGEAYCAKGEYREALRMMDRALSMWPWDEAAEDRIKVLRETARCAANGGLPADAIRAWEELAAQAKEAGFHELRVESLAELAGFSSDPVKTGAWLAEAAELAGRHLPPAEVFRHGLAYVDHLANRVRVAAAVRAFVPVEQAAEASGDPALLSEMLGWKGLLAAMEGKADEAAGHVERALRIAVDHELNEQVASAYKRRANISDYAGDYDMQKQSHVRAIHYCRETGTGNEAVCMSCLSYACFRTGDWDDALRTADEVLAVQQLPDALKAIALGVKGMVGTFRGGGVVAWRHLEGGLRGQRMAGMVGLEFLTLWARAYWKDLHGEPDAASAAYDEIRALWRETDDAHDSIPGLLFGGAHYADNGKSAPLADCVDILGRIRKRNDLPECRAALLALGAEQARLDGDGAVAERKLEEAVKLQIKAGLPLERMWVESRRGHVGDRSDAIALAAGLGAKPLLSLLRRNAGGGNDPAPTPRQLEVLCFLASGLTSKEMADRMNLSTRTVEMHVGRLLDRLKCRTRPEAVALAQSRGWLQLP